MVRIEVYAGQLFFAADSTSHLADRGSTITVVFKFEHGSKKEDFGIRGNIRAWNITENASGF